MSKRDDRNNPPEEELEDNIIELFDDEGNAIRLEHIMTLECEDTLYVAFLPIDDTDEDPDAVIFMRLDEDDEGNDVFYTIDSEDELDKVWKTFLEIYDNLEEEEGE